MATYNFISVKSSDRSIEWPLRTGFTVLVLLYVIGMVKKCGLLKIVHDHFKRTRQGEDPVLAEYIGSFEAAVESNKDIDGLISKNQVTSLFIFFKGKGYWGGGGMESNFK